LRSDTREATYLRSKLACDIHNRLGIPSISANYINLYINDQFMGLYIMMDAFKLSWAELVYNDTNSTSLYQCKNFYSSLSLDAADTCISENDDVKDDTEWRELLTALDNAESASDIEDIFDIDQFLTEIALEFLFGSWDHFLNYGHNMYVYKPKGDKWKMMLYDFDAELGQDIDNAFVESIYVDLPNYMQRFYFNYYDYTFDEWDIYHYHITQILIHDDPTRFESILKNNVAKAFNPAILFPHIDELKEFIKPYVTADKTPDDDGHYPGFLDPKMKGYSLEQWDANSEFTTIKCSTDYRAFGLKYWILAKYRFVCQYYNMDCDSKYMDENYEYTIDESVYKDENYSDLLVEEPAMNESESTSNTETSKPTTTTKIESTTSIAQPTSSINKYNCQAETIGYSCCPSNVKLTLFRDENGSWGYDFKNKRWCGLSPYIDHSNDECWSEKLGYKCCKKCFTWYVDKNGKWGFEYFKKCGIPKSCYA
ncbi:coth protein-domain-containing protein, partial [Neocallimastix sp. 'constans']